MTSSKSAARWLAISVFLLFSGLNYMDRQLVPALAPTLRSEFHMLYSDYGFIISVFSIVYAVTSPAVGLFLDFAGLTRGSVVILSLWSIATAFTGLASTTSQLLGWRAVLGVAQSGGIAAFGKASSTYLPPSERALGSAFSQLGISLGSIGAPLLAAWMATRFGWRYAFFVAGVGSLLWIPLWLWTERHAPHFDAPATKQHAGTHAELLKDKGFWGMLLANGLMMTIYSLWTNWTTVFLVKTFQMPEAEANRTLAWIPPLVATLGGFAGGAISLRLSKRGLPVVAAQQRTFLFGACALLVTAVIPYMPGALLATAAIAISYFATTICSVNLYAMPLVRYGSGRAGFAIASLTMAYGLMQTAVSPLIGRTVELEGFVPVCAAVAPLPLIAYAMLRLTSRGEQA